MSPTTDENHDYGHRPEIAAHLTAKFLTKEERQLEREWEFENLCNWNRRGMIKFQKLTRNADVQKLCLSHQGSQFPVIVKNLFVKSCWLLLSQVHPPTQKSWAKRLRPGSHGEALLSRTIWRWATGSWSFPKLVSTTSTPRPTSGSFRRSQRQERKSLETDRWSSTSTRRWALILCPSF